MPPWEVWGGDISRHQSWARRAGSLVVISVCSVSPNLLSYLSQESAGEAITAVGAHRS